MNKPIENIPMPSRGVYSKLQHARVQLQAVKMKKSGHNKFAGYTYFELGDFLPTINEIFAGLGLCGVVSFAATDATLRIVDTESGQEATFTCPMASAQLKGCHDVQNLGASITYIRRYLYVTALEIVEHDALDATTGQDKPKAAKAVAAAVKDEMAASNDERLAQAKEAADECLACLPDEIAFYEAYEANKGKLDADTQVAMWSLLYGDESPFANASQVKAALKRGKEALEAEIAAQA